jgi:hypothetical protein
MWQEIGSRRRGVESQAAFEIYRRPTGDQAVPCVLPCLLWACALCECCPYHRSITLIARCMAKYRSPDTFPCFGAGVYTVHTHSPLPSALRTSYRTPRCSIEYHPRMSPSARSSDHASSAGARLWGFRRTGKSIGVPKSAIVCNITAAEEGKTARGRFHAMTWIAHYFDPHLNRESVTRSCSSREGALRLACDLIRQKCLVHFVQGPEAEKISPVAIADWCRIHPTTDRRPPLRQTPASVARK